jgi:hypothetical protein
LPSTLPPVREGEAGKGDRKGGKSRKKMEFAEGADGKKLAKGDLWCDFHKVRCTHSTESYTDQALANANKARKKERAAKRFEKAEVAALLRAPLADL